MSGSWTWTTSGRERREVASRVRRTTARSARPSAVRHAERPTHRPDPRLVGLRAHGRATDHLMLAASRRRRAPDVRLDAARVVPRVRTDERDPHRRSRRPAGLEQMPVGRRRRDRRSNSAASRESTHDVRSACPSRLDRAGWTPDPPVGRRASDQHSGGAPDDSDREPGAGRQLPRPAEHLDLDAAAGQVAVGHERDDAVSL